jgi:hypothetical protein
MGSHQLAHILSRHADPHSGIRQTNEMRRGFNHACRGDRFTNVCQRACQGGFRICRLATELLPQAPGNACADQGTGAAASAEAFDQLVYILIRVFQAIVEGEDIFHCSSPESVAWPGWMEVIAVQLSTTLRLCEKGRLCPASWKRSPRIQYLDMSKSL